MIEAVPYLRVCIKSGCGMCGVMAILTIGKINVEHIKNQPEHGWAQTVAQTTHTRNHS